MSVSVLSLASQDMHRSCSRFLKNQVRPNLGDDAVISLEQTGIPVTLMIRKVRPAPGYGLEQK